MNKKNIPLFKKLFGLINNHQLLNKYVLQHFFAFSSNINCQEQLFTIQMAEKKNKYTVAEASYIALLKPDLKEQKDFERL